MWLTWNDIDRQFAALDTLRRELGRGYDPDRAGRLGRWPEAALVDDGEAYVFTVDVPGSAAEDVTIDVHDATLTVSARRALAAPEGYAQHRAERRAFEWKRSVTLPAKVDSERTAAKLEHGVLTVRLAKSPEAQPRRITVS